MKEFLKDVCGMVEISNLIRKEKLPEFLTFHITSFGELEPLLKENQRDIAIDMLAQAIDIVNYFSLLTTSSEVMLEATSMKMKSQE